MVRGLMGGGTNGMCWDQAGEPWVWAQFLLDVGVLFRWQFGEKNKGAPQSQLSPNLVPMYPVDQALPLWLLQAAGEHHTETGPEPHRSLQTLSA